MLEEFRHRGEPSKFWGIAYYTSQDVESAVKQNRLFISFSSCRPEQEEKLAIKAGKVIVKALSKEGLKPKWSSSKSESIVIPINWQFR